MSGSTGLCGWRQGLTLLEVLVVLVIITAGLTAATPRFNRAVVTEADRSRALTAAQIIGMCQRQAIASGAQYLAIVDWPAGVIWQRAAASSTDSWKRTSFSPDDSRSDARRHTMRCNPDGSTFTSGSMSFGVQAAPAPLAIGGAVATPATR